MNRRPGLGGGHRRHCLSVILLERSQATQVDKVDVCSQSLKLKTIFEELGILMEGEKKPVGNKESTGPRITQRATAEGLGAEISPPTDNTALYKYIPTHPHLHTRDAHGPESHLPSLSAFPGQRKWRKTKFVEEPTETAHGPCPRIPNPIAAVTASKAFH